MLKRTFDIVVSIACLTVLSLPLIVLAAVIRLDSRGPVFYRGVRVGRGGRTFRIFKFRSMVQNAENLGASSTNASDPRVTSVGRWIRRFKLDELPQLMNVLKGDMSLVGPRPEVQKFVDLYTDEEKRILTIRPGITDFASMKFHNEGEIIRSSGIEDADEAYAYLIRPEKLRLQLKYVNEQSFLTDVKIMYLTARKLTLGY